MRQATAKALRAVAYHTQGYDGAKKRRYYQYLKKRYTLSPRKERYKFFTQFKRV